MQIERNKVNKTLIIFLFVHLIVWTLIPGLSNNNLPLDTIEARGGGSARCMMAEIFLPKQK